MNKNWIKTKVTILIILSLFYIFVSQGSVATQLRCGGWRLCRRFVADKIWALLNHRVELKECWNWNNAAVVCVCFVEGVGDAVLSDDASQVSTRHADLPNDVRELWVFVTDIMRDDVSSNSITSIFCCGLVVQLHVQQLLIYTKSK